MALFTQQVCTHVLGTCCTCCMPQRPPFCQPGSLPISISREPNNAAKSGPGFSWCDISLSTTHKTHTLWEPEHFERQLCVGRGSSLELSQHLPETHLAALQVENTLWGLPSGAAGFSDFRLQCHRKYQVGDRRQGREARCLVPLCLRNLCYAK